MGAIVGFMHSGGLDSRSWLEMKERKFVMLMSIGGPIDGVVTWSWHFSLGSMPLTMVLVLGI